MKNNKGFTLAEMLCVITIVTFLCAAVTTALAGSVFGRAEVRIGTNGTATYTNLNQGAHLKLIGFHVHYDLAGIDTITVKRVTYTLDSAVTNAYTNTIGAIVTAATSNGWMNVYTNYEWGLQYGDKIPFQTTTGTANTGAYILVEFENQQH